MSVDIQAPPPRAQQLLVLPQDGFRTQQLVQWTGICPVRHGRLSLVALLVLLLVFGLGGVWAGTAKVGGVVTGSGRVVSDGRNVVVQSLEGGIIDSVDVKEGDVVTAGQSLARLNTDLAVSQLHSTRVQMALLDIELARWRAAVGNAESFSYDLAQLGEIASDERVIGTLKSQTEEFEASRDVLNRQLANLDATIGSEQEDIVALNVGLQSQADQVKSIQTELDGLQALLADGLTTRARVSLLERTLAQLESQKANIETAIKKSYLNIGAAEQQKEQLILAQSEEASRNVSRVQANLNTIDDKAFQLDDRIARSTLRAPAGGIVFRVNVKSVGAVLPAGETLVEIVPSGRGLSIETFVGTKDIGDVSVGQEVDITFSSDQSKMLAPLPGKVDYVSTDSVIDDKTGGAYYVVRASIPDAKGRTILPGNSAQVFFKSQPRTFLQYLAEPILRFANYSFTR